MLFFEAQLIMQHELTRTFLNIFLSTLNIGSENMEVFMRRESFSRKIKQVLTNFIFLTGSRINDFEWYLITFNELIGIKNNPYFYMELDPVASSNELSNFIALT